MKKNTLVKIGEKVETRVRTVPATYTDEGELICEAHDETYEVVAPIMEAQNAELTEEEIKEMEQLIADAPPPAPTTDDRLSVLEKLMLGL